MGDLLRRFEHEKKKAGFQGPDVGQGARRCGTCLFWHDDSIIVSDQHGVCKRGWRAYIGGTDRYSTEWCRHWVPDMSKVD